MNVDGTVEVLNNPEKNLSANIVIEVARNRLQTDDPTQAQKQCLTALVPYLAERIEENLSYRKLSNGRIAVDDPQTLADDNLVQTISDNVNRAAAIVRQSLLPEVPQDARTVSGHMNRVYGSGGGTAVFAPGADGIVPYRVAPPPFESPPARAVQDTVSVLSGVDKQNPYGTIKSHNQSHFVGRYQMSSGALYGWLADAWGVDLGNPPDYARLSPLVDSDPQAAMSRLAAQMQQMAGEHKISQGFADKFRDANFCAQFLGFIDKLQGKSGPISSAEVGAFMPSDLQESIAQNRLEKYARDLHVNLDAMLGEHDPGKLALSMFLGRPPTLNELSNPQYQQVAAAADNIYKLVFAGQFGPTPVEVTERKGKLEAAATDKILEAAQRSVGKALWAQTKWAGACQGGNLGCAASVTKVLQEAGLLGQGEGSAGVGQLRSALQHKGWKPIRISNQSQFRPGDVICHSGHIGIVGEVQNGQVWIYNNSSGQRKWVHCTFDRSSFRSHTGRDLMAIRPPEGQLTA